METLHVMFVTFDRFTSAKQLQIFKWASLTQTLNPLPVGGLISLVDPSLWQSVHDVVVTRAIHSTADSSLMLQDWP